MAAGITNQMAVKEVSLVHEKSRTKALFHAFVILFVTFLCFGVLSAACFVFLDFAISAQMLPHIESFHFEWKEFLYQPFYVFELYNEWWEMLLKSMRLMTVKPILFVPFIVPLGMFITLIIAFVKRKYSFSLWYVLNHHFAKIKDIEAMGLHKGLFMVLGRFANIVLSVKPAESVLCVGEMGTGKTSSVAIPSVLHSDNACIIAMDMTGLLPKYTAGHRASLGKIFYFNWDLLDEPEKGLFYPRWNPLMEENMPKEQADKEAYLKRLAGYLVNVDDEHKDNYWNLLAHSIIAAFLGYWTAKVYQARANDYFLGKLVEGRYLTKDEKDILLSYYIQMPESYTKEVIEHLNHDTLTKDNYLPIGSWGGIPEQWIGNDACFAAVTDWLIDNYMSSCDENVKDWRGWIGSLLQEAAFFSYGNLVIAGLKQFLFLSPKQRQLAFACVVKPFQIFTNQALRERTNGNDFNLENIRGTYDKENGCWRPVTIYSLANTYTSKILNQMFLDEVLYRNLHLKESKGPLPVMLVLDDVGHNLKLKQLTTLLTKGRLKKMSALLLCNSLSLVENVYSKEELECIVMNTAYKVIKAPNNQRLSHQLNKLAAFATKSVQIPKNERRRRFGGRGKYFADAVYFHQLAMDFNLRKTIQIDTRGHQIVLAEGYYNRPILANNIFFAEDERFKNEAVLDAEYSLSAARVKHKKRDLVVTPKIAEVFNQKDLGVDDLVELDQYMNIVFEETETETEQVKKVEDVKAKDISDKWEKTPLNSENLSQDWWLKEDAFALNKRTDENPFASKK